MFDEMEQDLILACKSWYGSNGIEKVISSYCGYDIKHVNSRAKYHFISELFLKLCNNNHIKITGLLYDLSPDHIFDFNHPECAFNNHKYSLYDLPNIICDKMISAICNLEVYDGNKVLIELHEASDKFIDRFKCTSCGKECFDHKYHPEVVFSDKDNCICEECSIDYEVVKGIISKREEVVF
jgi:hypothetical protein